MATDEGPSQNLPTGTITFLLTDIEGSTRRWKQFPAAMGDAVEQHNAILVSAIAKHAGNDLEKKGEGDSRFAVFTSARSALDAALNIQTELAKQDWQHISGLKVRIALHSGEAELRNNDYFGTVVNRSARMRGAAHGGQVILSEATKELIGGQLPDGVSLRDLGYHRFKDLEEADRIYQVVAEELEDVKTPLNSLSAAKHNLPVQLSSFIGRGDQLVAIPKLVLKNRLVTLFGVGGGGKTRLALQVAAELTDEFSDGVWFVDLAPIQDPEMVAQVIAQSLPISQAGKAPLDAIVDNYAEGKALIVVDNCEHLVEKTALVVNEILRRCPSSKVLATSRRQLSVQGECVYEVPPMNFDLNGKPPTVDIVAQLEAVELLRDRAAKRLSGEEILNEVTAELIYELCKLVDGIPLAIEQIAASLAFMSIAEARRTFSEHLINLGFDVVGVPDRQLTMEAVTDWSVNLLKEEEKSLFFALSIFDGGCTTEAAEFVCCESTPAARTTTKRLEAIARQSLITYSRPASRYRMLEPIRQFAANRLPSEELENLRSRHYEWFYNVANQAKAAGLDADNGRFYKLLNADYDNIRKALAWGTTHTELAVKTVELCNSMYAFWMRRGIIREGTMRLQQAMDGTSGLPEAIRAEALLFLGILQWQGANLDAAGRALQASYEAFDALGDEANKARAYGNLGNMAFTHRRFAEAKRIYLEIIPIFEKFGNKRGLARTLENLGVCESELGDYDQAIFYLTQSIELHRQLNDLVSMAKAIDAILGVFGMRGDLLDHQPEFLEAAAIALSLKEEDHFLFANLLDAGCQICIALEEFELAAQAFGAMERSMEEGQRVALDLQFQRHQSMRTLLSEKLGKRFLRAIVDGRALGAQSMLGLLCRRLEGEG